MYASNVLCIKISGVDHSFGSPRDNAMVNPRNNSINNPNVFIILLFKD
jgi:hypothetical protein